LHQPALAPGHLARLLPLRRAPNARPAKPNTNKRPNPPAPTTSVILLSPFWILFPKESRSGDGNNSPVHAGPVGRRWAARAHSGARQCSQAPAQLLCAARQPPHTIDDLPLTGDGACTLPFAGAAAAPSGACGLQVKPVCAQNGFSYINKCVAAHAGQTVASEGYCAGGMACSRAGRAQLRLHHAPARGAAQSTRQTIRGKHMPRPAFPARRHSRSAPTHGVAAATRFIFVMPAGARVRQRCQPVERHRPV
jgi:hypothetical protein